MKQFLLILVIFSYLTSCNTDQATTSEDKNNLSSTTVPPQKTELLSPTAENLYKIVQARHDTAMLLMNDITNVQANLQKTMAENPRLKAVEEMVLGNLYALKQADKAMMDWMHNFKSTEMHEEAYQAMSEKEILDYLYAEDEKMKVVHEQMVTSIAKGRATIQKYKK